MIDLSFLRKERGVEKGPRTYLLTVQHTLEQTHLHTQTNTQVKTRQYFTNVVHNIFKY